MCICVFVCAMCLYVHVKELLMMTKATMILMLIHFVLRVCVVWILLGKLYREEFVRVCVG